LHIRQDYDVVQYCWNRYSI